MNWLRKLIGSDSPAPAIPALTPATAASLAPLTLQNVTRMEVVGEVVITGFRDTVREIAFWPDSAGLVFSTWQAVVDWRIGAAAPSRELDWRPQVEFALSPDGSHVALAGGDDANDRDYAARLWRRADSFFLRNLEGPDTPPGRLAFAPDGQTLAELSVGGDVYIWSVADGRLLHTLPLGNHNYGDLVYLPDGTLAIADAAWQVYLWQPDRDRLIGPPAPNPDLVVMDLVAARGASALALVDHEGQMQIWHDLAAAVPALVTVADHDIDSCAFSPDGTLLASTNYLEDVCLWDSRTGALVYKLPLSAHHTSLAFSPDGRLLALGGQVADKSNSARIQFWGVAPATS